MVAMPTKFEIETYTHPKNPADCIFCISDPQDGTGRLGISAERILKSYEHWWLVIQPEAKRLKTKVAAGYLIAKRPVALMSELSANEFGSVVAVISDAAETLCRAVGSTYTGQYNGGFNEGLEAGQSVRHAHFHVLPVSDEDPDYTKKHGGIGGAFIALHDESERHDAVELAEEAA